MRHPGHRVVATLIACLTAATIHAAPGNAPLAGRRDRRAQVLTIRTLANQGFNAAAAHAAERFLTENPDHDSVESISLRLAGVYLKQDRLAEAKHLLMKCRRQYSYADLDGEAMFRLAEINLRRRQWGEAERRLLALRLRTRPASPFIPLADYYLGLCALMENRPADAARLFHRCAALYDGLEIASLSHLAAGIAEHRQGRREAAARAWEEALADTTTRIPANLLLATTAILDKHQFATGKRLLDALPANEPGQRLRPHYLLCRGAEVFFYGRRMPEPWLALMESHPLSPQTAFVLNLLLKDGDALTLSPSISRLLEGIRAYRKADHAAAANLLQSAAESPLPAVAPLAALYRARALMSLDRFHDAADLCELISDRHAMHALAPAMLLTAAHIRLRTGQLSAATANARSVIRRYPALADLDAAAFVLARARAAQGHYVEAAATYATLGRVSQHSDIRGPALIRAATAFRRAGDLRRARQAIGALKGQDNAFARTPKFLIEEARVTAEEGDASTAIAILRDVLADPEATATAAAARRALIEIHERAGNLDDAIAVTASAEEEVSGPQEKRDLFLCRMRLLVAAGRPAEAVRQIANLMARDRDSTLPVDVLLWQAARLHHLRKYDDAGAMVEHVLRKGNPSTPSQRSKALFYRAEQLRRSGALEEAEQDYHDSLQADVSSGLRSAAATALAFCRLGRGDTSGARAAIEGLGPAPNTEFELTSITLLADAALREGHAENARTLYAKILTRLTATVYADWRLHARYGLGASLELVGMYEEALVQYKAVASAAPAAAWAIADRENAVARRHLLENALR